MSESITNKLAINDVIEQYVDKTLHFLSGLNNTFTVYATSIPPAGDFPSQGEYFTPRAIRQFISAKFNARMKILCKNTCVSYLEIWTGGAYPKDVLPLSNFDPEGGYVKPEIGSLRLDMALKLM